MVKTEEAMQRRVHFSGAQALLGDATRVQLGHGPGATFAAVQSVIPTLPHGGQRAPRAV